MTIPCAEDGQYDYGLLTRNYVGTVCAATGQAGYVDYRFLGIVPLPQADLAALHRKGGHTHGN